MAKPEQELVKRFGGAASEMATAFATWLAKEDPAAFNTMRAGVDGGMRLVLSVGVGVGLQPHIELELVDHEGARLSLGMIATTGGFKRPLH